jgi:8-oxo-dGTP diphosphatase
LLKRDTRYQGAIVNNHQILLIKHREHKTGRSYWAIPGGGMEPGETGEECVRREMKEETNLDVQVRSLLMDEPDFPGGTYQRLKTYLCEPLKGEASPGFEPEPDAASFYSIVEVKWFSLRSEANWGPEITDDPITYPQLKNIRRILSYSDRAL